MSYRKGYKQENKLLHLFRDAGWFCIRAPGSGGGYDLIAAKNSHVIVMELKYVAKGEAIYFDGDELESDDRDDGGLVGVAADFGGHAYAVARWKQDTNFYALPVGLLQQTSGGNPKLTPEDKDRALVLPPKADEIKDDGSESVTRHELNGEQSDSDTSQQRSLEPADKEPTVDDDGVAIGSIEVQITSDADAETE